MAYKILNPFVSSQLLKRKFKLNIGFSLIELLTVVCLMTLMTAISIPAVIGMRKAQAMSSAVSGISLQLEQARTYAMANNTYVWVGFESDSTQQYLKVQIVAGLTGELTDLALPSTYAPLAPATKYPRLILQSINGIPGLESADDILDSQSKLGTFTLNGGGASTTYKYILRYSPSGEASISGGMVSRRIQIGLQPVVSSNASDKNVAALQVGGLTGQVLIFRP